MEREEINLPSSLGVIVVLRIEGKNVLRSITEEDEKPYKKPQSAARLNLQPKKNQKTCGEGEKRICAKKGCGTILRNSNPSCFCSLHNNSDE